MPEGSWEREAANWIRWSREPGHDSYWYYRDSFFELVPPPFGLTLDLGCGEGRVARDLEERGHRVVGFDLSATMVSAAREASDGGAYVVADGKALPFRDEAFTTVVAYNVLMDVVDLDAVVREAARVLTPGGRVCVSVTHPINDVGAFEGGEPDSPFVIRDSYLQSRSFEETFDRDGLTMTFRGWTHPLQDYAVAFERGGLLIERFRETSAPDSAVEAFGASALRWRRVPMFLRLVAVKPAR